MYGEGRNLRYVIGFGLLLVLIILAIVLIVHHGNSNKVPQTQRTLSSLASDGGVSVTETVVGPITADQNHDQTQITVSSQAATISVSKGYDDNVIASKSYPQTDAGFSEFLNALDRAGYTKGNTADNLKNDKGYCPTGRRYIFEVKDGSQTLQRFWATNCGGTKSYKGNLGLTDQLFQSQIPDYSSIVNNTSFAPSILDLN